MLRKLSIILVIGLLAFTAACSSTSSSSINSTSGNGNGAAASAPAAAGATCPTASTRKFAKTRFVADAALAGGAFKRYIYTPAKEGKFRKGANGKVLALVKAAAAGAFVINRLDAAKTNAEADPTLCKVLIAPLSNFTSAVRGLIGRARGGTGSINPGDVSSGNSFLSEMHSAASQGGTGFTDNPNASV